MALIFLKLRQVASSLIPMTTYLLNTIGLINIKHIFLYRHPSFVSVNHHSCIFRLMNLELNMILV